MKRVTWDESSKKPDIERSEQCLEAPRSLITSHHQRCLRMTICVFYFSSSSLRASNCQRTPPDAHPILLFDFLHLWRVGFKNLIQAVCCRVTTGQSLKIISAGTWVGVLYVLLIDGFLWDFCFCFSLVWPSWFGIRIWVKVVKQFFHQLISVDFPHFIYQHLSLILTLWYFTDGTPPKIQIV